jgi:hypothetical protein
VMVVTTGDVHDTIDTKRHLHNTYGSYESPVTAKLANGGHHAGRDFHAAVRNSHSEGAVLLKR